jgi:hypothetical protein
MQNSKMQPDQATACHLLNLSENDHNDMMLEGALEYLRLYVGDDNWGVEQLRKEPRFWKWWTAQWHRRTRQWLYRHGLTATSRLCREERYELGVEFRALHNTNTLNVYPSNVVMERTYALMLNEITHSNE